MTEREEMSQSVGLLGGEMIAHAVVVFQHLFVSSHVEVALEPVQVAKLDLCV